MNLISMFDFPCTTILHFYDVTLLLPAWPREMFLESIDGNTGYLEFFVFFLSNIDKFK